MRRFLFSVSILIGVLALLPGFLSAQNSAQLELVPLYAGPDSVVFRAVMTENINTPFALEAVYVAVGYDPSAFAPDMLRTINQHHFAAVGFGMDSMPLLDDDGVFPDIAQYGESHPNFGTTPIAAASVHNLCTFTLFPKSTAPGTANFTIIGNTVTAARTGYYVNTSLQNQPFTPAYGLTNLFYPIELATLAAAQNGKGVVVQWTTTTESNNHGFAVERRPAGEIGSWTTLAFVEGAGSTTQTRSYLYVDNALPAPGWYEYRLKQVDLDGTATWTRSVRVHFIGTPGAWSLSPAWPNPASISQGSPLRIAFTAPERAELSLVVTNALGQEIATLFSGVQDAGSFTLPWHASGLTPGLYFCTLTARSLASSTVWTRTEKIRLLP